MLIVGLVSSREEQREIQFIAEMCIVKERIGHLARQQKDNENNKFK